MDRVESKRTHSLRNLKNPVGLGEVLQSYFEVKRDIKQLRDALQLKGDSIVSQAVSACAELETVLAVVWDLRSGTLPAFPACVFVAHARITWAQLQLLVCDNLKTTQLRVWVSMVGVTYPKHGRTLSVELAVTSNKFVPSSVEQFFLQWKVSELGFKDVNAQTRPNALAVLVTLDLEIVWPDLDAPAGANDHSAPQSEFKTEQKRDTYEAKAQTLTALNPSILSKYFDNGGVSSPQSLIGGKRMSTVDLQKPNARQSVSDERDEQGYRSTSHPSPAAPQNPSQSPSPSNLNPNPNGTFGSNQTTKILGEGAVADTKSNSGDPFPFQESNVVFSFGAEAHKPLGHTDKHPPSAPPIFKMEQPIFGLRPPRFEFGSTSEQKSSPRAFNRSKAPPASTSNLSDASSFVCGHQSGSHEGNATTPLSVLTADSAWFTETPPISPVPNIRHMKIVPRLQEKPLTTVDAPPGFGATKGFGSWKTGPPPTSPRHSNTTETQNAVLPSSMNTNAAFPEPNHTMHLSPSQNPRCQPQLMNPFQSQRPHPQRVRVSASAFKAKMQMVKQARAVNITQAELQKRDEAVHELLHLHDSIASVVTALSEMVELRRFLLDNLSRYAEGHPSIILCESVPAKPNPTVSLIVMDERIKFTTDREEIIDQVLGLQIIAMEAQFVAKARDDIPQDSLGSMVNELLDIVRLTPGVLRLKEDALARNKALVPAVEKKLKDMRTKESKIRKKITLMRNGMLNEQIESRYPECVTNLRKQFMELKVAAAAPIQNVILKNSKFQDICAAFNEKMNTSNSIGDLCVSFLMNLVEDPLSEKCGWKLNRTLVRESPSQFMFPTRPQAKVYSCMLSDQKWVAKSTIESQGWLMEQDIMVQKFFEENQFLYPAGMFAWASESSSELLFGRISPYASDGSLQTLIQRIRAKNSPLPPLGGEDSGVLQVLRIFKAIVEAVHFFHSSGIPHGSLKPCNILLAAKGQRALLCDFPARTHKNSILWLGVLGGHPWNDTSNVLKLAVQSKYTIHLAPEVIQLAVKAKIEENETVDPFKADMWSVGCVLLELLGALSNRTHALLTTMPPPSLFWMEMEARLLGQPAGLDLLKIAQKLTCEDPTMRLNIWDVYVLVESIRHRLFFKVEYWPDVILDDRDGRVARLCATLDAYREKFIDTAYESYGAKFAPANHFSNALKQMGRVGTVELPLCEIMKRFFSAIKKPSTPTSASFEEVRSGVLVPRDVDGVTETLDVVMDAGKSIGLCLQDGYHSSPPLARCCIAYMFSDIPYPNLNLSPSSSSASADPNPEDQLSFRFPNHNRLENTPTTELIDWLDEIDPGSATYLRHLKSMTLEQCRLFPPPIAANMQKLEPDIHLELSTLTEKSRDVYMRGVCMSLMIHRRETALRALKDGFFYILKDVNLIHALSSLSTHELQIVLSHGDIASPLSSYTVCVERIRPLDPFNDVDVTLRNIVVDFLEAAPGIAVCLFLSRCTPLDWSCRQKVMDQQVFVTSGRLCDPLYQLQNTEVGGVLFRPKHHAVIVALSDDILDALRGGKVTEIARSSVSYILAETLGLDVKSLPQLTPQTMEPLTPPIRMLQLEILEALFPNILQA